MKVAVQHLNYSIEVQGHLDPFRAAQKRAAGFSAVMPTSLLPGQGGPQHTTGCVQHLSPNPKTSKPPPWPDPAPCSPATHISYLVNPDLLMAAQELCSYLRELQEPGSKLKACRVPLTQARLMLHAGVNSAWGEN